MDSMQKCTASSDVTRIYEKEQYLKHLNSLIAMLNDTLKQAKTDLQDITKYDVISMHNRGLLSALQRDEMLNSIDVLETTVANTPTMIKNTEQLRDEILDEINKMRTNQ